MPKIKFTKTEQKKQQDSLKQFLRFLPTLQLKKQQLQVEVRKSAALLEANRRKQSELVERLTGLLELLAAPGGVDQPEALVKVRLVKTSESNFAGIAIPVFEAVEFEPVDYDRFETDWYIDDAVAALKDAVSLREAHKILEKQYDLLSGELRTTSQRVNLFEKVKIPECRDNIRRIAIMLGDQETSSVARCKIAKRKTTEAASA
ncbi:MAG: V-type ATP synthase subunit D [Victivallaceae bacterium]|nr:V-type ATP synthase subunit D [Victivallaceae bacterium]